MQGFVAKKLKRANMCKVCYWHARADTGVAPAASAWWRRWPQRAHSMGFGPPNSFLASIFSEFLRASLPVTHLMPPRRAAQERARPAKQPGKPPEKQSAVVLAICYVCLPLAFVAFLLGAGGVAVLMGEPAAEARAAADGVPPPTAAPAFATLCWSQKFIACGANISARAHALAALTPLQWSSWRNCQAQG